MDIKFEPETTPSMSTDSVTTLISDSGITRYKLIAKNWQVFDKAQDPYWFFPKGFYLERFDSLFNVVATVKADTAWNFTDKHLWCLKGNVYVKNMGGNEFFSEELFWDERKRKVYSDKLIEIKKGDSRLKAYGFESNQEMDDYKINKPFDGKIPIEEDKNEISAPDSVQQKDTLLTH